MSRVHVRRFLLFLEPWTLVCVVSEIVVAAGCTRPLAALLAPEIVHCHDVLLSHKHHTRARCRRQRVPEPRCAKDTQ